MYPNLYYMARELFHLKLPALMSISTFGFFVALSFLTGIYFLRKDLLRKENDGLFSCKEEKLIIGKPAGKKELLQYFLVGFLVGFKVVEVFFNKHYLQEPIQYVISFNGNLTGGLVAGCLSMFFIYWVRRIQKLPEPKTKVIQIWPSDRMGDVMLLAAVFGLIGGKFFHCLEHWDEFVQQPYEMLTSLAGITFYGSLILSSIVIWFYFQYHKIKPLYVADSFGPALMLAYAIGRLGCHLSGDGDWGKVNNTINPFNFLPSWMWAYDYPHNVIMEGIAMPNCDWGEYCYRLALPVFPTPFYEAVICFILFLILWFVRKRITTPVLMASLYLIFNGLERFTIETLRDNPRLHMVGLHCTQAQFIAVLCILLGVVLFFYKLITSKRMKIVNS